MNIVATDTVECELLGKVVGAMKDYLIELLKQNKFCRARQVGAAFEVIIGLTSRETPPAYSDIGAKRARDEGESTRPERR